MNLSRTAIRYELSHASAANAAPPVAPVLLLMDSGMGSFGPFLRLVLDRPHLGPGAHEYFGRWILAWFFTQKLPLYFLSLPYRGGRAHDRQHVRYLNWRFYSGRSFGEWFASYSVWGAAPATLTHRRARLSLAPRSR